MQTINFTNDHLKMINKYCNSISSKTEFEIRFGSFTYDKTSKKSQFVSDNDADTFFRIKKSLMDQQIKFYIKKSEERVYQFDGYVIKEIRENQTPDDKNGRPYFIKKQKVMKYDIYDYDLRLSSAEESQLEAWNPSNHNFIIRKKNRMSFNLGFARLDLTIVEAADSTKYEIELEVMENRFTEVVSMITMLLQTKQNNFFVSSNFEKRATLSQYRSIVNSPYFVGAQPETLHKNGIQTLYKELYSVTDKADGERCFMIVDSNKQISFIDSNLRNVFKTDLYCAYFSSIIDGELLHINGKIHFYAFDLIAYNNIDIRGNQKYLLKQRLDRLNNLVGTVSQSNMYEVHMKRFLFNNVFMGSEILLNESKPYNNDGLIFTPMNHPYPTNKKWSGLLKWKPADQTTIDFYSINVHDDVWELYVQHIEKSEGQDQGNKPISSLVLFDTVKLCNEEGSRFTTSITSFGKDTIDPSTNEPYKTNTVIEYKWDETNQKFVPLRTRWDKTNNPKKHGNFSTVACDVWNNIHNPIDKELLFKFTTFKDTKDFFFEKMRKYHNKIKEYLYNTYAKNCESLLELCSGRGGDLQKWSYNNIKSVRGFDISEKNINECLRRIGGMDKKLHPYIDNYKFSKLDLSQDNTDIAFSIGNSFDVVCCQFGFHYFFKSETTFKNIQNFINTALKDNGVFIMTIMDDASFNTLLQEKSIAYKDMNGEPLYLLKKFSNDNVEFGNNIKVLLNGNNILGEGSDEYLINYKDMIGRMKDMGLELIDTRLFKDMDPEKYGISLSDAEKDISNLNRYCVFQKISETQKSLTPTINNTQTIFQPQTFDDVVTHTTIELHKNDISLYMVKDAYDVIDVLNCVEYKYYKNINENFPLKEFKDIQKVFQLYNVETCPHFLQDTQDIQVPKTNTALYTYFTYHKHVVEKKSSNEDSTPNDNWYDNWYIIMYKNKLNIELEEEQINETPETKCLQNDTTRVDHVEKKKQDILQECESQSITVKRLKEHLGEMGLKVSGKKDELLKRLLNHLNK